MPHLQTLDRSLVALETALCEVKIGGMRDLVQHARMLAGRPEKLQSENGLRQRFIIIGSLSAGLDGGIVAALEMASSQWIRESRS